MCIHQYKRAHLPSSLPCLRRGENESKMRKEFPQSVKIQWNKSEKLLRINTNFDALKKNYIYPVTQ